MARAGTNPKKISKNTLSKNLSKKWAKTSPDVFAYKGLIVMLGADKFSLYVKGSDQVILEREYGGRMMDAIKTEAKKLGITL